jgi:hypothetical protein
MINESADYIFSRRSAEDIIQESLRKLHFCSSNELVSPSVRRLNIMPLNKDVYSVRHVSPNSPNWHLILYKLFKHLPKFINLTTISCQSLDWTSQHLIDLCRLGRLHELVLVNCSLEIPDDITSTLRLSTLTISSVEMFPIEKWVTLFHPDTVSTSIGSVDLPILHNLIKSPHIMQYLQTLSTRVYAQRLDLLVEALSHLPHLQSLRLDVVGTTKGIIHTMSFAPLPLLRTFRGPCDLLCALSTADPMHHLRHVELLNLDGSHPEDLHDDPMDVKIAIISLGESARQLESLGFSVEYLTHGLLETVVDLCVDLKKLSISILGPPVHSRFSPEVYMEVPYQITSLGQR